MSAWLALAKAMNPFRSSAGRSWRVISTIGCSEISATGRLGQLWDRAGALADTVAIAMARPKARNLLMTGSKALASAARLPGSMIYSAVRVTRVGNARGAKSVCNVVDLLGFFDVSH